MDANTITRVLFSTSDVHVYTIPPLTSTKGFNAAAWTAPPRPIAKEIFTARLRVIETSISSDTSATKLSVEIRLEDSTTGDLFAAAPYTSPAVVQAALDSARFFAVRVQGDGGMKATLGVGFEDRSSALDFGIALSEARKLLGMDGAGKDRASNVLPEIKQDFSLKEGEKIQVQVGGKSRRVHGTSGQSGSSAGHDDGSALFSIAPPPPPAPRGQDESTSGSPDMTASFNGKTAKDLGFDDGEFGEFQ